MYKAAYPAQGPVSCQSLPEVVSKVVDSIPMRSSRKAYVPDIGCSTAVTNFAQGMAQQMQRMQEAYVMMM